MGRVNERWRVPSQRTLSAPLWYLNPDEKLPVFAPGSRGLVKRHDHEPQRANGYLLTL